MYTPALALIAVLLPAAALAQSKVNVTVYYESLCPDSQRFFNKQLYETFKTPLAMYMNLVLVPYGNANTTMTGVNCQHGVTECYGNRIQACAIQNIAMQDKQMGFINCLMQMAYDKKPANESAYNVIVTACSNWTDQTTIEQCAQGSDADNLIYKYGNMTKNANPPIKGVPTIFFNDKSNEEINANASKDFAAELCNFIPGTKPHECQKKSSASGIISSITLVISALVLTRYH